MSRSKRLDAEVNHRTECSNNDCCTHFELNGRTECSRYFEFKMAGWTYFTYTINYMPTK